MSYVTCQFCGATTTMLPPHGGRPCPLKVEESNALVAALKNAREIVFAGPGISLTVVPRDAPMNSACRAGNHNRCPGETYTHHDASGPVYAKCGCVCHELDVSESRVDKSGVSRHCSPSQPKETTRD